MTTPLIGISPDRAQGRTSLRSEYLQHVTRAGGTPIVLAHDTALVDRYLALCDGFILTGGDDPMTEQWGIPTHPQTKPVDPVRQSFEVALLVALDDRPDLPVLGICLGMQMMALHAGGTLDQHLPESRPEAAALHWGKVAHPVEGELGRGVVLSHHRQAVIDSGRMDIVAAAPDGIIEAVADPARAFYLGVQWHPERTEDDALGGGIFDAMLQKAGMVAQAAL